MSNRKATTPVLLRPAAFKGAEALQGPLNDIIKNLAERVAVLEQRPYVETLGPRRIRLPLDVNGAPATPPADFTLPPGPPVLGVFALPLQSADSSFLGGVPPTGFSYQVSDGLVRVLQLDVALTAGNMVDLTLGVIRG